MLPEGFYNVSERYGEQVIVTIADYRQLNPEGIFEMGYEYGKEVIVERLGDKPGGCQILTDKSGELVPENSDTLLYPVRTAL